MNKTSIKRLFFLSIFTLFFFKGVFAQTITVGSVDAGPYSQGSTIAVPISINDAGGCINQNNTFNVYLSDASGNFTPGTLIGSYTGFYAGFVNATIPNGTPAGAGYKVEVQSTSPAVTSSVSSAFSINTNSGVTSTVTSTPIGSDPNIFGRCIGISGATFNIKNTSSTGTTTATFFNEQTQGYEAPGVSIPTGGSYTFTANTSNYTIVVKNQDASGDVSTKGYQLINNVIQNNFGSAGNGFVCLASGKGVLSYTIATTGPSGISANYPGNTYVVNWGDGTSTTYTECQIAALGGVVSHTFTLPSCGQAGNGVANSFYVQNQAFSPFCGEVSAPPGISAKVLITPITSFTAPAIACTNSSLTIPNTSQPGPDPNATTATCTANPGALYDWTLDGVAVTGYQGVPLSTSFIFPAGMTSGTHTLTLHSELPATGIGCQSADYTQTICFEKPPVPAFTIAPEACAGTTVTPVNTSVSFNVCSTATYSWSATGPGTVSYTGGTSSTSQTPQMVFSAAGTYTVQLGMLSGCGTITTTQTINIDGPPTASLSPALTLCGNPQTLTFSPTQTTTKTTFGGTTVAQPTSYSWTVTGGTYSFVGGTTANSEYPQIQFNDIAAYIVTVTNQNTCGSAFAVQHITLGVAPIVNAGPDQTVCASAPATTLAGAVTGTYSSYQWVGGAGTFNPSRTVLNPVYTPTTGEIAAGSVTLTLQGNASIPAPCNIATDNITINITPTPAVTSATTAATCSKQALSYTITANQPGTTFKWTASATTGTPTGFTASGSGSSITDVITNTGNVDAVVTYLITPTLNGCPGNVFTLKVTIHPLPVITAAPVASPICSNLPANIALASNVANTTYTWTSTASAGITGNTNQSTAKNTTSIQDVLVNSNTVPGTVTYVVTPYNGTCAGAPVTTSITVEPSPVIANAGPNTEICNATSYTLQGNSASPGSGKWTVVSASLPGTITFSDATNPAAVVSGLVPGGVYQFQWTTSYYATCPSSSSVVKITDDTPPVGGTTSSPAEVCSGSNSGTITLAGQSGTVLRWESSVDGGATWQPITNTTTVQSYSNLTVTTQFRAVIHNGVCTDVPSAATQIKVDAPPVAANAGPNDEVCNVTTYTLQGNNPSPGTGAWTVVSGPSGATFSNPTNPNAVVSNLIPGSTYQFQWTITATGSCPINSKTVTIIIDKPPVGGTTAGTAEVCMGSNNGQITLSGQFGTVLRWESSIDNGTTWQAIANTGVTQSYTNLTQTTEFRAILQNGTICANVPSTATTVTVDAPPVTASAGPANEVCSTTTYTLQGNNPSPGTGKWTVVSGPAGATFSDSTNPNAVVSNLIPGSVYQFQWTIKNTGVCAPSTNSVNIVIDKSPVGGTTSSNATVCTGSNGAQITLAGQFGTVVRWESSVDGGTTWQPIATTGTTQSYLNLTQTTEYRAILHNGVCADVPSAPTTITVSPLPVTSAPGANDEVCSTTTYTLQGNDPTPGTGLWTVLSGPAGATFSDPTKPNAVVSNLIPGSVYQFKWTITSPGTCPPSSNSVTITIDKSPVGGTTSGTKTVCIGTNGGQVTLAGQFGTIVRWESSVDGGTTWQAIANTSATQSYLNLTQTTEYRAILHNGVCPDVNSTPTTITVMPLPVTSVPGANDEICGATSYTLQGNNPSPGTGLWTVLSGPTGAVFSDPTNPHAVVSGLTPGIYQFQWTITGSSSCPSSSNSVTITIDAPPVGGTTSSNTTVCIGSNGGQITLAGQFGTILRWEMSVDNGTTWQTIANTGTTQSYSNLTQTTEYRAILHNSSTCADVASSITTITVAPLPIASSAGPDDEVCGITSYALHGNNPSPGTGLWTVVGGPAGVTFSDATNPNAIANGLIPGNVYQFEWTITTSATCPSNSSTATITIDKPPVGGTATANPAEVCYGSNGGQVTLTGQFGTIFGWQMSTDNGVTWQPIGNSTTTQSFTNLTQNTEYRAILHNSNTCADVFSTPAIITVDPMPVVSNPGANAEVCSVTTYTLQGNNPSPGTGKWTVSGGPAGATFSDDTNPNAVVSGLIPGNLYQFKWTITSSPTSTCPPSSNTVNITIDAAPVGGTTSGTAEVCSGSNGGTITLSGQVGSVTQWELSVDNGVTWQPVANATASLSYLNLTQTTEYRANVHSGSACADVKSTPTTITVDAPPTTANAGADAEVCSVTTYTLSANSPGTGTGKWTVSNGPAGAVFSDVTNPNATVSGLIPGNIYQFKWTITGASTSCPPSVATVNITIDKAPVGGTTSSNATVCSGSNVGQITLTGQFGTVLRWESSIDGRTTWQSIVNTGTTQAYNNLTQTTEYRAVLHNSNTCADVTSTVTTITVDLPPVVANAGTDAEVCSVTTYTLNGNSPGTGTGKWTVNSGPAGATFVDATNPNTVVNGLIPGSTYQFKWTITATASCPPSSSIVNITIDKAPIGGTTSSPAEVCSGSNTGQINLTGQFGTVVRWESSTDGGTTWQPIANTGAVLVYTNLTQTTTYRAVLHNSNTCADVTSTTTTITVDLPPVVANAGTDAEVCSVTTYTLSGNSPGTGTGKWTVNGGPAGATFVDATNPNTVVNGLIPGSTYQFKWTITATASCPPSSSIVNITIDKSPIGGTTSSPAEVCSGSNNGQIALAGQFGTVVRWESSTDGGTTWQPIANTGLTQVYNNLTQTTTYRAVLHNSNTCADVTSTTTTITVDLPPVVANAGTDAEVCSVTTYTLSGNSPGAGTGKWTVNIGPAGATFVDATNPNTVVNGLIPGSTYQFKWTITATASCPPSSSTVNIIIDKAPIGGTTSSPAEVCSGSNNGQIALTGQFGTILRWESSTDGGTTWQPIANTGPTQAYTNLTQTTTYRAVLHNSTTCADVTSSTTTITVDAPPPVANAGSDAEVCSITTYTLHGDSPAPGTGLWTVNSGPSGAVFSDATNPNAVVSGLIPGSVYQFKWTITGSASCPPSSAIVNITVDKAPVGGSTATNATVCSGSNTGQITLSGQFGTVVRWEFSTDAGVTWQPISNTSSAQSYTNLTQTTQYRAVIHNSSTCADVASTATIITVVAPPVVANAGTDDEVCNVTSYTLHGNAPAPGSGLWTINSGPAGAIFTNAADPNTTVIGLIPGSVYQFQWTITGSVSCPPSSAVVNITIDLPPIGGTTSAPAEVCSGSNGGTITLAGQFGTIVRWESSTNNGVTWVPIANTGASQSYLNLTQTTQYRAVLHNSATCADVTSTATTISVDTPPPVADAGAGAEVCNVTTYTLQGNNPAPATGKWTILSGVAGAAFSDDTTPNAVVTGLIPGNAYQFKWTITGSASCPPSSSIVTVIIDQPPVGGTTSVPATVCSGSNGGSIALAGQFGTIVRWESSTDNGTTWQPIANTNTTQSYFNLTQTTEYRAVLHNSATCADVTSTATTITVDQPPVVANAGPADEVCSVTTYTLHGNNPGTGTGAWSIISGPAGATFSNVASPNATVSGLIPGNVYQFQWTITGTASCPPSTDIVNITIDKAPIGGTTSSPAEVCSGSNTGQINLLGQFGTIVRWESSTDGGATWQPISNTTNAQAYFNLTQTTQFRAVLHNSATCADVTSTATTITVDLPPVTADAGTDDEVCSATTYTLNGNSPGTGTGKWTVFNGPAGATFSDPTDPNAIVSGLIPGNVYQFEWTITGTASCPPSTDIVNITIDKAPIGGTTSGIAEVCSGSNSGVISLAGQFGTIVRWEFSTDNGATWQPIANTNNTQHYTNLTQTTQYRAVIHNSNTCADVTSTATVITVDMPPIAANAGADDEVCSVTSYNLNGNNPAPGTGLWTVESGPAGATFSDATNPNAIVSGLIPGNTYQFKWTITGTASCPPTSDLVNITIDKAPIGGTTSGTAEVCSGSNSGQITLAGQFGTVVRWESSTNNGSTWQPIADISVTLLYVNLTQTTQYRAILHNSTTCADVPSTATTIKVDQPPVQADAGSDETVCNATAYNLNGNNAGSGTGMWTVLNGPAGATFSDPTSPTAVVSGLIPGNAYQFEWTITGTASCPPTTDIVTITIDKAPIGGTTTSPTTEVCYGNNAGLISLTGQFGSIIRWEFSTDNGATWQPISNTNNTVGYSDLTQTTQFRGVVHNGTTCGDVVSTSTTIIVDPLPVTSVPGPNDVVCNVTTYTLHGNSPAPGTGLWTVVQGPAGVTFSDPTNPNAVVNGLIPGNIYVFNWAITGSKYCSPSNAVVTITIDKAPIGGTTSSPATVCWGTNEGQVTLTGQFGTIVRWESSIDNGASWQPIANSTTTQTYLNLTRTTQYHAILHNGTSCSDVASTPTTITVNDPTPVSQAGQDFNVCNQTTITLNGNFPGAGGGVWTQTAGPAVNIVTPSNYSTQVTGLSGDNTYTFKWTIFGLPPCANTESVVNVGIHTDVVPSFTMDKSNGCGPTIVTFTNTSTPSPVGMFVWNFGDGSPSVTAINPPPHTFPPSSDGTEKTYDISLTPLSNCGSQTPFVAEVTVSSLVPIAQLLPNQVSSCGAFTLTAKNLSPGDNEKYDFYLVDQNGAIVQHLSYPDKEDAVFQPVSPTEPTTYELYMIVTDKCGDQAKSTPVNIFGAPSTLTSQIQIKGDISSVCLGSPITFQNISTGGDKFTITIYDSNKNPIITIPASTSDLSYTPTAIGTYYVSIVAGYVACGDAPVSAFKEFTVYPIPAPSFTYTVDENYNATFFNTTPEVGGIPASALIYTWDFGDGSSNAYVYAPTAHKYDVANSPFRVTLTATTPGSSCMGITSQVITIQFHGNAFIPNAFMPASSKPELKTFYVKGTGLKTWHMQVFNNFGQLLWESTALDSNGTPTEGWDGTYKGKIVEQGVYIWQCSGTLLNGEEWKGMSYGNGPPSRTGPIHLIR